MRSLFKKILFFFFLIVSSTQIFSQNIKYSITNYTSKDYGRGYEATNMAIAQDNWGLMYFANASGVLQYDSKNWRFIPINKSAWVTSLASNANNGIIYVGSQNEFGYLVPDSTGNLSYFSLSGSLQKEDKYFSNIVRIHVIDSSVIFQAEEKIFIFKNDTIKTIKPETSFHLSFKVNNTLFVKQREVGLMKMINNKLRVIEGSGFFKNIGIFSVIPLDNKNTKLLVASYEDGLFILSPKKSTKIVKLKTVHDDYISNSKIYGGLLLNDNNIALNTLNGGIIIIDSLGNTKAIINKSQGIGDDDVKSIFQDKHNNIWLALNNGISKINYNSPLSFYSKPSGIAGTINTITRFNNKLFIGSSNGLYLQNHNQEKSKVKQFSLIQNFSKQVWELQEINNSLIIGTNEGLYEILDKTPKLIYNINAYSVYYSERSSLLFVGGKHGLAVFKKNANWKFVKVFDEVFENIKRIKENKLTNHNETELWLGTSLSGVIRIIIDENLDYRTDKYDSFDGLIDDWVLPFEFNEKLIFGTKTGLMKFIDEEEVKSSLPDSLKNKEEYARGYFDMFPVYNNTINEPVSAFLEKSGRVWMTRHFDLVYFVNDNEKSIVYKPFKEIDMGKINIIYPDNDYIYWMGAADGLIRFDLKKKVNYEQEYHTLIREVSCISNDSAIFKGAYKHESSDKVFLTDQQPDNFKPVLAFKYNSLSFDFSAPFYTKDILFSHKLIGYDPEDSGWSDWNNKTNKEYTNLHEGEYCFIVKAINIYNQESVDARYCFTILSPWYRTIWAYMSYIILLFVLVYIIIKISLQRLEVKNRNLERIVEERTVEIRQQKDEIKEQRDMAESQRDLIAEQKMAITDSIHYASKIQNAVIPSEEFISGILKNYFILYKPRDIVSGDFYWFGKKDDKIIIIAADCTGHGVPGAFMSMLGVAFLNEIVNKENITSPDVILNTLRDHIIKSLKQHDEKTDTKDGMDIAAFTLDMKNKKIEYAGAHNPLYIIRNNELIVTKADKMPVAIHVILNPFVKHEIDIIPGDKLYVFSDGFVDQFGGPRGRKFMTKAFKQLLVDLQDKPMSEQKTILDKTFEDWKGDEEQVDDVLVLGVMV